MLFKLFGLVRDELYMLRSLRILLELIVFEPIVPFEAPLALRLNGRVVAEGGQPQMMHCAFRAAEMGSPAAPFADAGAPGTWTGSAGTMRPVRAQRP